jgi:hypothetical protein
VSKGRYDNDLLPGLLDDNRADWDYGLTPKLRRFVEAFCTDGECFFNASAAYRKTYTRKAGSNNCDALAAKARKQPYVEEAIGNLTEKLLADRKAPLKHDLVDLWVLLATYDPADIIDQYGKLLKPLASLGRLSKCVRNIKQTKYGTEVELADRYPYVRDLATYLGLKEEAAVQVTSTMNQQVVFLADKKEVEEVEFRDAAAGIEDADEED